MKDKTTERNAMFDEIRDRMIAEKSGEKDIGFVEYCPHKSEFSVHAGPAGFPAPLTLRAICLGAKNFDDMIKMVREDMSIRLVGNFEYEIILQELQKAIGQEINKRMGD